ncbi:DUF975 family protein [Lentilactobacillus sp. Marseille-Q4993]|uniref:DUF975 family protein n=1 Tax=Lentilactobacillus sp. Marseille-Q4993 TaxID=3039492 RepID=UPI0024BCB938|nr:DUF975 family protein [Lentilactobacillus sp. Marseille-Q4993]
MGREDRVLIKESAKKELNSHFSFYLVLCLCAVLSGFVYGIVSETTGQTDIQTTTDSVHALTELTGWAMLFGILASLFQTGALFTMIDRTREEIGAKNAIQRTFAVFDNGKYFTGWIFISILQFVFIALWSILFLIPGIIKSYSYSQALYIYRDAVKNGEDIGYLEAITRSRRLMDGKKWFYFVMQLSFIGWMIVAIVTAGIASFWVIPYLWLSIAKFYTTITDEKQQAAEFQTDSFDSNETEKPDSSEPEPRHMKKPEDEDSSQE